MFELHVGEPTGPDWQAVVLEDLKHTLINKLWSGDVFVRGSLARGFQDAQSDIDLVVTVSEDKFAFAVNELFAMPAKPVPGRLPAWIDGLVPDFGGIGVSFLVQVDKQKWGEIDIYLLPHSRRQRLLSRVSVGPLRISDVVETRDNSAIGRVDATRQQYTDFAANDIQQGVLGCYVAGCLLRKRFVRGNRFQAYADKYAFADCVRDLVVRACYPDRQEQGWRALSKVAERSADPKLVMNVLSIFAQQDVLENSSQLASRVAALEQIVALLAPITWREHGESLRSLGRYLLTNK